MNGLAALMRFLAPVVIGGTMILAIADLKAAYTGPLTGGADLQCTPIRG